MKNRTFLEKDVLSVLPSLQEFKSSFDVRRINEYIEKWHLEQYNIGIG